MARQTKKSYEKVFANTVSMGLVGAGYHDYDKDYIFATVQTLNKDEHLMEYKPDAFDCIVLDDYEIIGLILEAAKSDGFSDLVLFFDQFSGRLRIRTAPNLNLIRI